MKSLMFQSCWKGICAASSKLPRRERDQAQPQMPMKVTNEATVATMRKVLTSMICSLLERPAQRLQVRDQRVLLGLAFQRLGRRRDLGVGVGDARDAQRL